MKIFPVVLWERLLFEFVSRNLCARIDSVSPVKCQIVDGFSERKVAKSLSVLVFQLMFVEFLHVCVCVFMSVPCPKTRLNSLTCDCDANLTK